MSRKHSPLRYLQHNEYGALRCDLIRSTTQRKKSNPPHSPLGLEQQQQQHQKRFLIFYFPTRPERQLLTRELSSHDLDNLNLNATSSLVAFQRRPIHIHQLALTRISTSNHRNPREHNLLRTRLRARLKVEPLLVHSIHHNDHIDHWLRLHGANHLGRSCRVRVLCVHGHTHISHVFGQLELVVCQNVQVYLCQSRRGQSSCQVFGEATKRE